MLCTSGFMDDFMFAHKGRVDTVVARDDTASCAG